MSISQRPGRKKTSGGKDWIVWRNYYYSYMVCACEVQFWVHCDLLWFKHILKAIGWGSANFLYFQMSICANNPTYTPGIEPNQAWLPSCCAAHLLTTQEKITKEIVISDVTIALKPYYYQLSITYTSQWLSISGSVHWKNFRQLFVMVPEQIVTTLDYHVEAISRSCCQSQMRAQQERWQVHVVYTCVHHCYKRGNVVRLLWSCVHCVPGDSYDHVCIVFEVTLMITSCALCSR